ncbi:MAG: hypothetical protein AABX28_01635 [Nanoarchaeota archaeon]
MTPNLLEQINEMGTMEQILENYGKSLEFYGFNDASKEGHFPLKRESIDLLLSSIPEIFGYHYVHKASEMNEKQREIFDRILEKESDSRDTLISRPMLLAAFMRYAGKDIVPSMKSSYFIS